MSLTIKDIKLPIKEKLKENEDYVKNSIVLKFCGFTYEKRKEPALEKLEESGIKLEKVDRKYLEVTLKININKKITQKVKEDKRARIYFFVTSNRKEIKKIGGSVDKNGILGTLNFYLGGMSGSPGRPRFIVNGLIKDELFKNRVVECWVLFLPLIEIKLNTVFKNNEIIISSSSYKEYERIILDEYRELSGDYPEWNFQESKKTYPHNLERLYNIYHKIRISEYIKPE